MDPINAAGIALLAVAIVIFGLFTWSIARTMRGVDKNQRSEK